MENGIQHLSYKNITEQYNRISEMHEKEIAAAVQMLHEHAAAYPGTFVILDDDPTGVQAVHDIAVYTTWSEEILEQALEKEDGKFFILTNSRGLTADASRELHEELLKNLYAASARTGKSVQVISRSDSTLRGHFPLETDLIAESMEVNEGRPVDGCVLCPFFEAGGRLTIDDVHYVKYGDELVPAAQTEFAKDQTFGYMNSYLPAYVEEKTNARFKKEDVVSVPLALLREGNVNEVEKILLGAQDGQPVIVNALAPDDVRVFAAALYAALAKGKRFVYRTAADYVKAVLDITTIPFLNSEQMKAGLKDEAKEHGGLIIVGSHTEKTTRQLNALNGLAHLDMIAYNSDLVLENRLEEETERCIRLAEDDIAKGITPVIFTSRKVLQIEGDTKEQALERSVKISAGIAAIAAGISVQPGFIIAKGGITSSDVGTRGLGAKRAWVPGQILPGVPVWILGDETRFPGSAYVIFPGNVGDDESLKKAVEVLK